MSLSPSAEVEVEFMVEDKVKYKNMMNVRTDVLETWVIRRGEQLHYFNVLFVPQMKRHSGMLLALNS
jgi:hypothetical protein